MTRSGLFAVALGLLWACDSGPPARAAKVWTVQDFVEKANKLDAKGLPLDFGGWRPEELVVEAGQPLLFPTGTQSGPRGLTLFPAVAAGKAAAFVITEIWQDHPTPWVQPVWMPRDEAGRPLDGVNNVFPVGIDSTFYSPFWRAEELLTEQLSDTTYRSARDVLSARPTRRSGSIIFCPFAPGDTGFADDGSGTKDPMTLTLATLKPAPPLVHPGWLPLKLSEGWVDGQPVLYFDFGLDHAPADEQTLAEAPAYFFVRQAGDRPLPLAAVLPPDALRHALIRRVDVVLPPGAAPFVPPGRAALRALLLARDPSLTVPELVDPALDAFPQLVLRVAANPACFSAPGFPADCDWLDSPARLEALRSDLRLERQVQLGIGVVLP